MWGRRARLCSVHDHRARPRPPGPAGAAVLRQDVTEAIRAAVLEELAAVGFARMSIEAVARRAGVGKTAVYRRWKSKLHLVLDLVGAFAVDGLRRRRQARCTGTYGPCWRSCPTC